MARPPSMKKIRAAYDSVRPAWLRRKGVLAVEVGLKTTRDAKGRERSGVERMTKAQVAAGDVGHLVLAIIVYVEEKLAPDALRANQLFPKEVDGVPVDVQTVPATRLVGGAPADPIPGGVGIARQGVPGMYGTLTFGVVETADPAGPVQYLTCAHIAFAGPAGHPVMFQPPDGPHAAAFGKSAVNGIVSGAFVDAALIRATPPRVADRFRLIDDGSFVTVDGVGSPAELDVVRFCGATTVHGLDGVVSNADTWRTFQYSGGFGNKKWLGLFEIECAKNRSALGGDSGSAVYRLGPGGRVEVLGMVLGTATSEGGRELTYAQPFLGSVGSFENLGVTL